MKVVILDDQNILILAPDGIRREQIWALQEQFNAKLPGWNVIVFGPAGEIVDLPDRPDLSERAGELGKLVKEAIEEVVK